jgi:hypothetical protein
MYPMQISFVCNLCKLQSQSHDIHPITRLRGETFYHLDPPTITFTNHSLLKNPLQKGALEQRYPYVLFFFSYSNQRRRRTERSRVRSLPN